MDNIQRLEQLYKNGNLTVFDVYNCFKRPFFRFQVMDEADRIICFWVMPFIHKKIAKMKVKRIFRKGYTICDNRTTYIVV